MSKWIPVAWERDEDVELRMSGSYIQITCSTSPFYEGVRYAVRYSNNPLVLNRDGYLEREPLPSNRDEEFYKRCRFESFEDAKEAAETFLRGIHKG